jgi:hypothetical protein
MTHAEAKELVLDLAYGELPPDVAAEVEQHVAGCAECREEQANIGVVRASFAPMREPEQPSHGFDAKVFAAAKTEAQLTHDGNIGKVIEVSGTVVPMQLAPSRIDAHAAPVPKREARRRPKWMLPAALSSLAAAAALVLVIGTNVQLKSPAMTEPERLAIHVQAAAQPSAAPAPAAPPAAEPAEAKPPMQPSAKQHKKGAIPLGAGGDAADSSELGLRGASGAGGAGELGAAAAAPAGNVQQREALDAREAETKRESARRTVAADKLVPAAKEEFAPPPPPAAIARPAANEPVAGAAPPPSTEAQNATGTRPSPTVAQREPAPASPSVLLAERKDSAGAPRSMAKATQSLPADLEQRAEAARHAGNYALAAGLYRQAADERKDDPSAAAWDLAHAVECLSAAGSFDDARAVRDQLSQSYPEQKNAAAAAGRALRAVDAAPASAH